MFLGEAGVSKWLMNLISSDVTEPQHYGSPCVYKARYIVCLTSFANKLAGPSTTVHVQVSATLTHSSPHTCTHSHIHHQCTPHMYTLTHSSPHTCAHSHIHHQCTPHMYTLTNSSPHTYTLAHPSPVHPTHVHTHTLLTSHVHTHAYITSAPHTCTHSLTTN